MLVRTKGAEIGVRTKIIPGLDSSLSVFILDQASEIVFEGDAGDTSASRPSQRYGFEWTNQYRPNSWLDFDADLSMTHARFVGFDSEQAALYASLAGYPQAQLGNAPGNYIPNAPAVVASAGITIGEKTGYFGTLRWRYLGASPLTEDNAFRSPATSIVNARIGYRWKNGWSVHLDILNLLNTQANQITYAYGSIIKTDSLYNLCFVAQTAPACRLPERRHGLRSASDGAACTEAYAHGPVLIVLQRGERCNEAIGFSNLNCPANTEKYPCSCTRMIANRRDLPDKSVRRMICQNDLVYIDRRSRARPWRKLPLRGGR